MTFRSRSPEPFIPNQELSAFALAGAAEYLDRAALIDSASGRLDLDRAPACRLVPDRRM
jgi:hypothetical protein